MTAGRYAFGSNFSPASAISSYTGLMAPFAAIIVAVPTSNTCTMCGCCLARNAAIAPVMTSV